jgi:hypothetical protein
MFGFYSVCNPFFMKEKITTDLRHILGCSFGIINTGSEPPIPIEDNCGLKEDYFRTCGYYKADGKVVRINYISMKTKYLKNKGIAFISTPRKIDNASDNRKKYHLHEYNHDEFRAMLEEKFDKVLLFSQNDEIISSQNFDNAWNYIAICFKG